MDKEMRGAVAMHPQVIECLKQYMIAIQEKAGQTKN